MYGGVSKTRRSGASVQTLVASLAGNTDVTCSSGVVTIGTSRGASTAASTEPPLPPVPPVPPLLVPPVPAAPPFPPVPPPPEPLPPPQAPPATSKEIRT